MSAQIIAIGCFSFGEDQKTVTLAPGLYELHEPITFGITEQAEVRGVCYQPFPDDDALRTPAVETGEIE
jgi:hypothetical protein